MGSAGEFDGVWGDKRRFAAGILGGLVVLLLGVLIGLAIGADEPNQPSAPATSPTSSTPATSRAVTTTTARTSERVVGRASGGGSGSGGTSITFEVTGSWRIEHQIQGAAATIMVVDQSAGYSHSYTPPVGSGRKLFTRTCKCRVTVRSPKGSYALTVFDVAD